MSIVRRAVWATVTCAIVGMLATGALLWAQGYRVYVIHTGSMAPTYRPGDVVVDRPSGGGHLRAGEVITFRHSSVATDVVTHRITDITAAGLIHTKGDANASGDVWDIRPDQVRGSAMFGARHLGYLLVFLDQPAGIASLVSVVLAVACLWRVFFPGTAKPATAQPGTAHLVTARPPRRARAPRHRSARRSRQVVDQRRHEHAGWPNGAPPDWPDPWACSSLSIILPPETR